MPIFSSPVSYFFVPGFTSSPALGAHDLPDLLSRSSSPLPLCHTHKLRRRASERARGCLGTRLSKDLMVSTSASVLKSCPLSFVFSSPFFSSTSSRNISSSSLHRRAMSAPCSDSLYSTARPQPALKLVRY